MLWKQRLVVVCGGFLLSGGLAAFVGWGINVALQGKIDAEIDIQVESDPAAVAALTSLGRFGKEPGSHGRYKTLRPLQRDWVHPSWKPGGKRANPYRILTARGIFTNVRGEAEDGGIRVEHHAEFKRLEPALNRLVENCYDSGPYVLFRMYSSCTYIHIQFVILWLWCWGLLHTIAVHAFAWARIDSPRQEYPKEVVLSFLLKVLPLMGFIGTVISMPEAIDKAHALVGAKDLHEPFKKVTSALAAKFDTTFLGLLSTVLLFMVVDFSGEGVKTEGDPAPAPLPTPPPSEQDSSAGRSVPVTLVALACLLALFDQHFMAVVGLAAAIVVSLPRSRGTTA